jgi:hypothetical protein
MNESPPETSRIAVRFPNERPNVGCAAAFPRPASQFAAIPILSPTWSAVKREAPVCPRSVNGRPSLSAVRVSEKVIDAVPDGGTTATSPELKI